MQALFVVPIDEELRIPVLDDDMKVTAIDYVTPVIAPNGFPGLEKQQTCAPGQHTGGLEQRQNRLQCNYTMDAIEQCPFQGNREGSRKTLHHRNAQPGYSERQCLVRFQGNHL
jgi:hypothetical protein